MITREMIAPCGLDCTLCTKHLEAENPCMGCFGPDECKTDFCRSGCAIVHCGIRKGLPGGFCYTCEKFPCPDVTEKETRYANDYPMLESPEGNLAYIHRHGMESFLKQENRRWACPECGNIICVHNGVCSGCGKKYTNRIPTEV